MNLMPLERKILYCIASRELATKREIMFLVWPSKEARPHKDLLRVAVCHLRKKLEPTGIKIETLHSVGYRIPSEFRSKAMEIVNKWPTPTP